MVGCSRNTMHLRLQLVCLRGCWSLPGSRTSGTGRQCRCRPRPCTGGGRSVRRLNRRARAPEYWAPGASPPRCRPVAGPRVSARQARAPGWTAARSGSRSRYTAARSAARRWARWSAAVRVWRGSAWWLTQWVGGGANYIVRGFCHPCYQLRRGALSIWNNKTYHQHKQHLMGKDLVT